MAERLDDLRAGGQQAGLGQVVAEEVDGRNERLRLQRQQPRGLGEVVAVGVRVDLDPVADDLRVEDVGAAAEVDDVEDVEVLAQLVHRDVELAEHLLGRQAALVAGGADQRAGEGDQAGEALGPDHRLGAAVGAARAAVAPAGAVGHRAADRLGDVELLDVAIAQQLQALVGLLGQLGRRQQRRVLAPRQHPRDQLAAGRVLRSRRPRRVPCPRRAWTCGTSRGGRSRARPARRSARAGRPSAVPLISPICQSARWA